MYDLPYVTEIWTGVDIYWTYWNWHCCMVDFLCDTFTHSSYELEEWHRMQWNHADHILSIGRKLVQFMLSLRNACKQTKRKLINSYHTVQQYAIWMQLQCTFWGLTTLVYVVWQWAELLIDICIQIQSRNIFGAKNVW